MSCGNWNLSKKRNIYLYMYKKDAFFSANSDSSVIILRNHSHPKCRHHKKTKHGEKTPSFVLNEYLTIFLWKKNNAKVCWAEILSP